MININKTKIHTVGDKVTYKNKLYMVVNEDFDCGGNLHILGLVKIFTYFRPIFLKVKYVDESMIEDLYQQMK